ncbi:hypothetical protein K438DRAFT_1928195, partial [Mycena galopus ATCC 62051]
MSSHATVTIQMRYWKLARREMLVFKKSLALLILAHTRQRWFSALAVTQMSLPQRNSVTSLGAAPNIVLDRLKKKKRRNPGDGGEGQERAAKSARHDFDACNADEPANSPPPAEPDVEPDINRGTGDADGGDAAALMPVVETPAGHRMVLDDYEHDVEEGEDDIEMPSLASDDDTESETDLELDPEQLEKAWLTAAEILEGEFEREEMHREQRLNESAMNAIRAHNLKVNIDLGARAYEKMKRAFPQLHDLPSLYQLQARIAFLSGIKPVKYHCCKGSCCCFVGPYEALDACPYCEEPRYDSRGRPRASFDYL